MRISELFIPRQKQRLKTMWRSPSQFSFQPPFRLTTIIFLIFLSAFVFPTTTANHQTPNPSPLATPQPPSRSLSSSYKFYIQGKFSQSPLPDGHQPNDTIIRVPYNRLRDIVLPTLAPSDRFILRIAPAVPTPAPSASSSVMPSPGAGRPPAPQPSIIPESPASRPETAIAIDLIAPRQHRLILTAAGETPAPCPLNPLIANSNSLQLPSYCSLPQTDTLSFITRSSRAFVYVKDLAAETPVILSVTNADGISLSGVKLHFARIKGDSNNPQTLCPGSALEAKCSSFGTCDANGSVCECPRDFGGRACHVPVPTLPPAERQPQWNGAIRPLENSTLVNVSFAGRVARIRPPGPVSRVSVRARILVGGIDFKNANIPIDNGDALLNMFCKVRGANEGSGGLDTGTDIPTIYDDKARATIVRHPLAEGGDMFDLVCVSKEDVGAGEDWLISFVATSMIANTSAAAMSVISVRVLRCGSWDLPECPLGVRTGTVSLVAWVGIGVGVVIGIVLLVAILFWACRTTIKGLPGSQQGGILDGRLYQVVDYGKSAPVPRHAHAHSHAHAPTNKVHSISSRTMAEGSSSQEERVYPRIVIKRKSHDSHSQQPRLVEWDAAWQFERERRLNQFEDSSDAYRMSGGGGVSGAGGGGSSSGVDGVGSSGSVNVESPTSYHIANGERHDHRDTHNYREIRDMRDMRDLRDLREYRESRDMRDRRERERGRRERRSHRELVDQFEHRSQRDPVDELDSENQRLRERRDYFERRALRDTVDHGDLRNQLDLREQRELRDQIDLRELQERLERRERPLWQQHQHGET